MKHLKQRRSIVSLPLTRTLLRFLTAGFLSAGRVFSVQSPFALGFIAASGGSLPGLAALAGAIAGAALSMDFSALLRLSAIGILLFSAATSLAGTKLMERHLFYPVLCSFLTGSVELIYLINGNANAVETAQCFSCITLVGLAACYFPAAEDFLHFDTPGKKLSHLCLLACLIAALQHIPLPLDLSFGCIGGALFSMVIAFLHGPLVGTAAGLGMGLLLDLTRGGNNLFFTAAYGLASFFLGFQRHTGKLLSAALYGVVLLFFLMPLSAPLRLSPAYEFLLAAVIFLALPLKKQGGKYLDSSIEGDADAHLRTRLTEAARAFEELSMSFPRLSDTSENPSVLFERTAEQVCSKCSLADTCWEREYQASYDAFNNASAAMLLRGRAEAADFPQYFASRCTHFPAFLAQLNAELSAYLQRQQYRSRLTATQRLAQGQYSDLAELLSRTAAASTAAAPTRTSLVYRVGAAARPKKGESISGDSIRSFESDDGHYLFLLLSDGMGTGLAAQKESNTAVRLLERFLRAGIPAEAALKTLHSAMTLRSAETGCFTTVDLLSLDLYSGDAVLYKYGAAPSLLREGKAVRRIRSVNLPAGLNEPESVPERTELSLAPDTVLLLVSDGLVETEEDRWLTALLRDWTGHDPQSLTALILCDSLDHGGENDDCAVMVLTLPNDLEKV